MQRITSPVLLSASHKHSSCLSNMRHAATLERQPECCTHHIFLMQSAAQIAVAAVFRFSIKPQTCAAAINTQIQAMPQAAQQAGRLRKHLQLADTCNGEVDRKQHKEVLQQVPWLTANSTNRCCSKCPSGLQRAQRGAAVSALADRE